MPDLVSVAAALKRLAIDLETEALRESGAATPRLLLGVRDVMERTGLGRDESTELIKRAGAVRLSNRLVCRPADLDAVLISLKEKPA